MADALGGIAVDRSAAALEARSGDAWPRDRKLAQAGRRPPLFAGVVRPTSAGEVAAVLAAATAAGVPVVPVGLRSGICGALSPRGDEVALDLSGLDCILAVDDVSLVVEVELEPLCTELHLHGSHFYRQGASAYAILYIDAESPEAAIDRYDQAWAAAMEICLKEGAAIGHHHGVGRVRLPWLGQALGTSAELFARVRRALDPDGILSPDRLAPTTGVRAE